MKIKMEDMIERSTGGTGCPVETVPVTTEPTVYTVYMVKKRYDKKNVSCECVEWIVCRIVF